MATALIPFLEHDDANRALMGSNMQRQAVPLLEPESPIVGTGMEERAARDSGQVVVAAPRPASSPASPPSGSGSRPTPASSTSTSSRSSSAATRARASTSARSSTSASASPTARRSPTARSTQEGELALGRNVLVAFMSWEGGNYEDAIVISDRLVRDDLFTSIHIEKHEIESRDTKLGPEEITRDIPNVGEESLKDLDEEGIVYIGAEVRPGDILVGKITPEGRDRADRGGAPPAGDLRREGPRGEGLQPAPAPRRARQGRRDPRVPARAQRRPPAGRQPPGPGVGRPEAQDQRRRQDGRPPRQQGRHRQDPAGRRTCRSCRTGPRSTSSSTRSACRAG